MDPIVELQHYRRENVHDLKNLLALVRNNTVLNKHRTPEEKLNQYASIMTLLDVRLADMIRIAEPEFERPDSC